MRKNDNEECCRNNETITTASRRNSRSVSSPALSLGMETPVSPPSKRVSSSPNLRTMKTPPACRVKRGLPSTPLSSSPGSLKLETTKTLWEDVEDRLAILLDNDATKLQLFEQAHTDGVWYSAVLMSLAHLACSSSSLLDDPIALSGSTTETTPRSTADCTSTYTLDIEQVAHFLAHPAVLFHAKLAALRLLLRLRSPEGADWQWNDESVVRGTLRFVVGNDDDSVEKRSKDGGGVDNSTTDLSKEGRSPALLDTTDCSTTTATDVESSDVEALLLLNGGGSSSASDLIHATESSPEGTAPPKTTATHQQQHTELTLLWELRATCRQFQRHFAAQETRRRQIQQGASTVARLLLSGAKAVDTGLSISTKFVTDSVLTPAGGWICDRVSHSTRNNGGSTPRSSVYDEDSDPDPEWLIEGLPDEPKVGTPEQKRSSVVARAYADAARRTSESTRLVSELAIGHIRDASTEGIQVVAQKLHEEQVAEKLLPDEGGRCIAAAAGQVGMASLGAVAVVGEAVLKSTRQVAHKTAHVTADVVEIKYGASAGQVVRDAADTAGNIICTMTNVAMLQTKALTKVVAKNTGKHHLLSQHGDEENDGDGVSDVLLFEAVHSSFLTPSPSFSDDSKSDGKQDGGILEMAPPEEESGHCAGGDLSLSQ